MRRPGLISPSKLTWKRWRPVAEPQLIPIDKLKPLFPKASTGISELVESIRSSGVLEPLLVPGMVNVDFADLRAVMSSAGAALIGVGESDSEKRAEEAVYKAINNPLLDIDITGAK